MSAPFPAKDPFVMPDGRLTRRALQYLSGIFKATGGSTPIDSSVASLAAIGSVAVMRAGGGDAGPLAVSAMAGGDVGPLAVAGAAGGDMGPVGVCCGSAADVGPV